MRTNALRFRVTAATLAVVGVVILAGCPLSGLNTGNWFTRAGGEGSDRSYGIDVLADGTSLITGYFTGDAEFCGCPDDRGDLSTGGRNAFVGKWGADGVLEWVRNSSGDSVAIGNDVCELTDGSIVLTGSFTESVTFGDTAAKAVTLTSGGDTDAFIAKYSSTGEFVWAAQGGGTGADVGFGVAALPNGGVAMVGRVAGSATFCDASSQASHLILGTAEGTGVLLIYDADGVATDATVVFCTGEAAGTAVSAYADGSVVMTGYFSDSVMSGGRTFTSVGGQDAFVLKLSPALFQQWFAQIGGAGTDQGNDVQVNGDSCVVAGLFSGTATFSDDPSKLAQDMTSAGGTDAFVAKCNASGEVQWVKQAGGEADDVAHSVDVSDDGTLYMSGSFQEMAAFGPGEFSQTYRVAKGEDDTFVAHLSENGNLLWVRAEGGTASDIAYAVGALADGAGCIATGRFRERAYFGPDPANRTAIDSRGYCDFFVQQYLN